ncbi:threonine-phosphate decarboxylase CobD [Roseobacteraceae bacterium S113]
MRDHGGDMDRARATFGAGDWIDLSTGINPVPYPVPAMPSSVWGTLPTRADVSALEQAAQSAYGTTAPCVALAGAQGAIQLVPRLMVPGEARVLTPTYNEHAGALEAQGWRTTPVSQLDALEGAALAVVVNPNNPDGRSWSPEALTRLAGQVGLLVVDESFCDMTPERSILPKLEADNVVVMRSFGKFFGLAGARLGFAFSSVDRVAQLRALAGPWAVSGPAIALGRAALSDRAWQDQTRARLSADAARMDDLAARAGWTLVGGTTLFRTYDVGDAGAVQTELAHHHIWSRIFPYAPTWMRLGLPGTAAHWARFEAAIKA